MDNSVRRVPSSIEAEQSVLGSILIDPEKINEVASIILETDFYNENHREIYAAMRRLFLQSKDINSVLLSDELVKAGVYDIDGSKAYIRTLADTVPTSSNVLDYAKIVKEKSMLRQLIEICDEVATGAYDGQEEASFLIDAASSKMFALAQNKQQNDFWHIRDVLVDTLGLIREASETHGENAGIKTGFSLVDHFLVGMGKGDLIILGARPGMGKTSFALNVMYNVAKNTKKQCCVFSLEMSREQLVMRMLASEALVDSTSLRSGMLSSEDWESLAKAASCLSECEIFIDDTTDITVTGMKAKLRKKKNLGFVVIDHLQLMQSETRIDNRAQMVGEISRNLKLMAKELRVPIMVCTQLSRNTESRQDKRPMLSDLRDSGAIEQDADSVMFLYRDMYYADKSDANENVAEVILAKNRHGSTGNATIGWYPQYTKFTSISDQPEG